MLLSLFHCLDDVFKVALVRLIPLLVLFLSACWLYGRLVARLV